MHALALAFRNLLRNKGRTLATVSAIMISCAGLLLFSGYVTWAHWGGESHTVTQVGHLQIFRKGFYERGAGNPSAFTIDGYEQLKQMLWDDPVLKPRLQLVTGQLLTALLFDQLGLFSLASSGISPGKLLGVALLFVGAYLINRT